MKLQADARIRFMPNRMPEKNKDHIDHLGVRRSRENECCIRLVSLSGT